VCCCTCARDGCRSGCQLQADSIATFSVDSKSGRELRPYLTSVTDKCEQNAADLPKVIVIDGLHHISSPLSDAFNGFLNVDCKSRWLSRLSIFLLRYLCSSVTFSNLHHWSSTTPVGDRVCHCLCLEQFAWTRHPPLSTLFVTVFRSHLKTNLLSVFSSSSSLYKACTETLLCFWPLMSWPQAFAGARPPKFKLVMWCRRAVA